VNSRYTDVSERAGKRCEYCRAPERAFNFPFKVEHIVPRGSGGDDDGDNLALACRSCNAFKSTRQSAEDPETSAIVALFHPRRDLWAEHFSLNSIDFTLIGIFAKGRATIVCLRLNSVEQLLA